MFHLTTSYFLTGESKPWGAPVGVNVRGKPDQPYNPTKPGVEGYGSGGVELKARYQEIDMSEFGPVGPPPSNRENWALGVNWYLTENLIFMTEYEHETLLELPGDPEQSLLNTQLNLRM